METNFCKNVIKLYGLILNGEAGGRTHFADKFKVTERSISSYFKYLKEKLDVKLQYSKKLNKYYIIEHGLFEMIVNSKSRNNKLIDGENIIMNEYKKNTNDKFRKEISYNMPGEIINEFGYIANKEETEKYALVNNTLSEGSLDMELFTVKINEEGSIDLKLSTDIESSLSATGQEELLNEEVNTHLKPITSKIIDAALRKHINGELFTAILNEDGDIALKFSDDVKASATTVQLEELLKDDVKEHLTPIIKKLITAAF
ncbi:hypothetical protein [uncultured Clostridium sp.]|uniref:hypothetical protein n=1 Tax=uncultured Clostridium sp. TaxID=59620 RepID=UPI0028E4C640|nr:hypothetical protein [uncultured Clostridium sp.]